MRSDVARIAAIMNVGFGMLAALFSGGDKRRQWAESVDLEIPLKFIGRCGEKPTLAVLSAGYRESSKRALNGAEP